MADAEVHPDAKMAPKDKARRHRRLSSKMRAWDPARRMKECIPRLCLAEDGQLEHLAKIFPAGGNAALQAMTNLMQSGVVDIITWQPDSSKPEVVCAASGAADDRVDLMTPVAMPPTAGCTLFDTEQVTAQVIEQLRDSVAQATRMSIRGSEEPLVDLAAKCPLQVCVLVQRIRFTKMYPKAVREGRSIKTLITELESLQNDLTLKRREEVREATTLEVLILVVIEQINLLKKMAQEKEQAMQAEMWKKGLQVKYDATAETEDASADTVELKFDGEEAVVGNEFCGGPIMVTTEFTHLLRGAYINTMKQEEPQKRVLTLCGPPGAGKERLMKDVGRLMGTLPTAIRAFDSTPTDTAWWERRIKAAGESSGGRFAPFIVSQADRLSDDTIRVILEAASQNQVSLCFTVVPGERAQAMKNSVLKGFTFVTMPEPEMTTIAEGLLSSQGLVTSSFGVGAASLTETEGKRPGLPVELCALLEHMSTSCTKQQHYDFGTRTLAQLCGQIGDEVMEKNYKDEKSTLQTVIAVVQRCLLPRLLPEDIEQLKAGMASIFGFSLDLPEMPPDKRFQRTVEYVRDITKLEPDCMVLPLTEADKEEFMIEFNKGLNLDGATKVLLDGKLCDYTAEQLLGSMPKPGEPATDGLLVTELRKAMDMPNDDEHKVWVVIETGDISMDKWESIFELLNDSGRLNLASGEQLRLADYLRYMFVLPGAGTTDPNVFARSAVIWTNP
eukprot:TRINITY_DN62153_c0_g1_i1.p1 TRINITY_DN62153_c0_g1~~TRINITY_DN62153_c0_g1_i1.p1  ORF type:complete len:728 (-),score=185.79 TRINITY_DN62153_c0_g1_i1:97-2280(-)